MSNSGPPPGRRGTPGSGGRYPGRCTASTVCADNGTPMSPRSMARRAVCSPGRARCRERCRHGDLRPPPAPASRAPIRSMPIGFSLHTCLPAAMMPRSTSNATAGIVRLTTISTSGCASTSSRIPAPARRASPPATRARTVEISEDDDAHVGEAASGSRGSVADHPGADEADADRPGGCHHFDPVLVEEVRRCSMRVEHVAIVVVELDDGELGAGGRREDREQVGRSPVPGRTLVEAGVGSIEEGVGADDPVLGVQGLTRSPRRSSSATTSCLAGGGPVEVDLEQDASRRAGSRTSRTP